jgi:hypothetical protein
VDVPDPDPTAPIADPTAPIADPLASAPVARDSANSISNQDDVWWHEANGSHSDGAPMFTLEQFVDVCRRRRQVRLEQVEKEALQAMEAAADSFLGDGDEDRSMWQLNPPPSATATGKSSTRPTHWID